MRDVHIMVEVELMRSDGNYGRDRAVCQLSGTLSEDEGVDDIADWLLDRATRQVEGRLARSTSIEVRRTMLRKTRLCNECQEPLADDETGYLHPACDEAQRERYQRQREEQNKRWEEERQARELAGVGARPTGQNGEDIEAEQDYGDSEDDEDRPL